MKRDTILGAARQWLGTPYLHQAATLGAGCDCLGLLRGVWRQLYGDEPMALPPYRADRRDLRFAPQLREAAERLLLPAGGEMVAGQVLLFRIGADALPRHCGIATGSGGFIHAQERLGVLEMTLADGWRRRIAGRYDFPGVED